jgi:hypothetical protein
MMANVRRRSTSVAIGELDGDSAVRIRSDISEPVAGKPGAIKGFCKGLAGQTARLRAVPLDLI